jgi:hypothetical protein
MEGAHFPGPPPWNPGTEAWPGGPHPGSLAHAHEEAQRRSEEEARAGAEARQRLLHHLLLLR